MQTITTIRRKVKYCIMEWDQHLQVSSYIYWYILFNDLALYLCLCAPVTTQWPNEEDRYTYMLILCHIFIFCIHEERNKWEVKNVKGGSIVKVSNASCLRKGDSVGTMCWLCAILPDSTHAQQGAGTWSRKSKCRLWLHNYKAHRMHNKTTAELSVWFWGQAFSDLKYCSNELGLYFLGNNDLEKRRGMDVSTHIQRSVRLLSHLLCWRDTLTTAHRNHGLQPYFSFTDSGCDYISCRKKSECGVRMEIIIKVHWGKLFIE